MIHGYGGNAMLYYKTWKDLYPFYQIHSIDIYGSGYSSLGNWSNSFTPEQVEDYHIGAIEEWRKAHKIQKFELCGHSYGGYLGTLYARKYRERVSRLILMSPAGFRKKSEEEMNQFPFLRRLRYRVGGWVFSM